MSTNSLSSTNNPRTPFTEGLVPKTTQTKGLHRNTIDKYYTKESIVDICLTQIGKNVDISTDDLLIEPSAGNGAFIPGIKSFNTRNLFYDLTPEHPEIIEQDYLQLDVSKFQRMHRKIHIIGNPPFGRQSSTAIRFIQKSCAFCDSVSFILPKSFKKDSLRKSFPLQFHLVCEIDLPEKSFLVDGIEHTVPCVFQIWEKRQFNRAVNVKLEPNHFVFVKQNETPDISFRRVGVNAGTIDRNIHEKSAQSHYFIRFTNNKPIEENIAQLSTITYDFNNTVGPKSISTQELIHKFNDVLNNLRG
jgi:hypothetical protein